MILHADCLIEMKKLEANSIDAVVTDPPYGLSFMNKHWDYSVPSIEVWREVLRVLKPGGHVLSFGGTRTYHRMVVNIEDAGFEIRDQVQWLYGSGFPKSHDVSKAIDKAAGAGREVLGPKKFADGSSARKTMQYGSNAYNASITRGEGNVITAPATDAAKQWQGWGTALKPANEPICLARKPLSEKTVAQNVLRWGTGALSIDASRVGLEGFGAGGGSKSGSGKGFAENASSFQTNGIVKPANPQGRWPSNVILGCDCEGVDHGQLCMVHLLDEQSEISKSTNGGASRFFYVAKASKKERNAGLSDEVKQKQGARPKSADASGKFPDHDHRETGGNNHPTVKPQKLMEYLIKLITPPGGVVLDPFAGSGSTLLAAKNLGFKYIGIEMDADYFEIAKRRLESSGFFKTNV